jgi:hypothetical protein
VTDRDQPGPREQPSIIWQIGFVQPSPAMKQFVDCSVVEILSRFVLPDHMGQSHSEVLDKRLCKVGLDRYRANYTSGLTDSSTHDACTVVPYEMLQINHQPA